MFEIGIKVILKGFNVIEEKKVDIMAVKDKIISLGYRLERVGRGFPEGCNEYIWTMDDGSVHIERKVDKIDDKLLSDIIKEVRYIRYNLNPLYKNDLNDFKISMYIKDMPNIELSKRIGEYDISITKNEILKDLTFIDFKKDCFMDLK